jgi:hypothetical protein
MSRTLGWLQHKEDAGHLKLTATPFRMQRKFAAPDEIDPRNWLRIADQGPMSSCSGHAMSSCLELLNWFRTGGQVIRLSRIFAYLAAQKMDGLLGRDTGATISGTLKAAKTFGVCLEKTFPYPRRYPDGIPTSALAEAAEYRVVAHAVLCSYAEVFKFLSSGVGAIQLGIPWQQSLADNDGVIEEARGHTFGGHTLAVLGYVAHRQDQRGRKYLIVANSHGLGWGDSGFALVAPQLFDDWGRYHDSHMIGVSDLDEYQPRPINRIFPLDGERAGGGERSLRTPPTPPPSQTSARNDRLKLNSNDEFQIPNDESMTNEEMSNATHDDY